MTSDSSPLGCCSLGHPGIRVDVDGLPGNLIGFTYAALWVAIDHVGSASAAFFASTRI